MVDESWAASARPLAVRIGVRLLWTTLLKTTDRTKAPTFVNARLMSPSVSVVAEFRARISVVLGCLKVPGEGVGVVGCWGALGVETFWGMALRAGRNAGSNDEGEGAIDVAVVDMMEDARRMQNWKRTWFS